MGNRTEYRKRQDRFFDKVSKKWGLERGEVKDFAETNAHISKQEWQKAKNEVEIQDQEEIIKDNKNSLERQGKVITDNCSSRIGRQNNGSKKGNRKSKERKRYIEKRY